MLKGFRTSMSKSDDCSTDLGSRCRNLLYCLQLCAGNAECSRDFGPPTQTVGRRPFDRHQERNHLRHPHRRSRQRSPPGQSLGHRPLQGPTRSSWGSGSPHFTPLPIAQVRTRPAGAELHHNTTTTTTTTTSVLFIEP